MDAIEAISVDRPQYDVIVLDGHLSHKSENAEDAREICKRVRALGLPVYIIGLSSISMPKDIQVDNDLTKLRMGELPDVIDALDRKVN